MAQLPQLQRLKLRSKRSFWYNSLHQLPALTRLDATDMPYFAVAVVALTRLQHLDLPQFTYIPEGLTDLTCLVSDTARMELAAHRCICLGACPPQPTYPVEAVIHCS